MGITNHAGPVARRGDDQVDARRKLRPSLTLEPRTQRRRLWKHREGRIPHQRQVAHEDVRQGSARGPHPHHLELAPGQAERSQHLGEERRGIVAGRNDRALRSDPALARSDKAGLHGEDSSSPDEGDTLLRLEEGSHLRNRVARLDANFVRTEERRGGPPGKRRKAPADLAGADQLAAIRHRACGKGFEQSSRFRAARGGEHASLVDLDVRCLRQLEPDLARAPSPPPHRSLFLAGDGDEAEVPDRSPVGPGVALDDDDPQAASSAGKRMRQADDPCPDDCDVEFLFWKVHRMRQRCSRPKRKRESPSCSSFAAMAVATIAVAIAAADEVVPASSIWTIATEASFVSAP